MALSHDIGEPLGDALSLVGRSVVVLGACPHLGAALVTRFADAGAAIVVASTDAALAHDLADGVASRCDSRAVPLAGDPADPATMGSVADRTITEFGRLDIWVQVASGGTEPPYRCTPRPDGLSAGASWGGYLGARAVAFRMSSGAGGVIVNVAPWPCCGPGPETTAYGCSPDGGLAGITRRLAVEFAPFGVRVFAIAPTTSRAPTVDRLGPGLGSIASPGEIDSVVVRLPLGHGELLDDASGAALFCASDLSMFMSGSTLLASAHN